MSFDYAHMHYAIRDDLPKAYQEIWLMISKPGNWWTGAQRVAIAGESRLALQCELCAKRKTALSPNSVHGEHHSMSDLPPAAVDAVHRIVTDASRLTATWFQELNEQGVDEKKYVELLGIVVAVISIDAFHRAMGLSPEPLPSPMPGEPDEYTPEGLVDLGAWVPMISPSTVGTSEADLYGGQKQTGNVVAAMSIVPDAVRMLKKLSNVQYLEMADVPNPLANGGRMLSRPQIELLAGRVSSINDCFY